MAGTSHKLEDTVASGIESLCSLFDNVYLLRSVGVIGEDSWLFRTLNKGQAGSKVWLVSLVLAVRRSLRELVRAIRLKWKCHKELGRLLLDSQLREKLLQKVQQCNARIVDSLMDLVQNALYMVIVLTDIFKWKRYRRVKVWCEYASNAVILLRMCNAARIAAASS